MSRDRELKVKILGDASGAQRAFSQTSAAGETAGKKFGAIAKTITAAGVGAGIAFAKSALSAAGEAQKVAAQTQTVIKSTGSAAGVTAGHVGDLAERLKKLSGVEDEAIQTGANMLLTFTNVQNRVGAGNDIFDQATKTMLDMSVAMGTDQKSAAMQLGKALNDPIKGVGALSRVGVTFTDQQKEQIRAMVEAGDVAGAQKIILAELNKEFGGSAKAQGAALTPAEKLSLAWGDMQEKVGAKLMPALTELGDKLVGLIDWFDNLSPGMQTAIGVLAGVAAGVFVVVKAIQAWQVVQAALNVLLTANPIGLVVIALAALAAGLYLAWTKSETFRDVVVTALQFVVDKWLAGAEWITKAAATAFGWIPGIGGQLKDAAKKIELFRDEVNSYLNGIKNNVPVIVRPIWDPRFIGPVAPGTFRFSPNFVGPIPPAPPTADGGIFNGAQLRIIGEAGPEAVIPLDPAKRARGRQLAAQSGIAAWAAGGIAGLSGDSSGSGDKGVLHVHVNMPNTVFVGPGGLAAFAREIESEIRAAMTLSLERRGNFSLSNR